MKQQLLEQRISNALACAKQSEYLIEKSKVFAPLAYEIDVGLLNEGFNYLQRAIRLLEER